MVLFYRLIDAVRDSLDRAGREPYALQRIVRHDEWLDFALLQDYLDAVGCDEVPLYWEGRSLPVHDSIKLSKRRDDLRRIERTGGIFLREDALLAAVLVINGRGFEDTVLIAGERRPGALKQLIDDYRSFARAHSRTKPWITVIGDENLPRPRGLDWDSLVLDPGFRDDLRTQVDAFFTLRDEYVRMGVSHRRGMLFTGPPGNGKTSALRVIASVRDEPFILHKVKNHTDQCELDDAFNRAMREAPAILCFEDVDSLFDGGLLSHFLNRIDGLYPLEGVLILATTNHPEKLDGAITERPSRFDRLFHFGNPGPAERWIFLKQGLDAAFDEDLVKQTDGFSMAQVKEVRVSACLESIHAGLPGPTKEGALRSIERLRGQRAIVQTGGEPERSIGFQWSRGASTQTAKGRSDVK